MGKKSAYTFVIEQPLGAERSASMIRFLTEQTAKRQGFAVSGSVRERRPGETGMVLDKRERGGGYGT